MTSDLDVEALLDSVAPNSESREDKHKSERRRDDRDRDSKRRERSRDRRREDRDRDGDATMRSPRSDRGSTHGSHSSRKRSRSRDRRDRNRYPDDRDDRRGSGGDYYRGSGRARTRSRSPDPDRYYRPTRREREEREEPRSTKEKDRGHGRAKDSNRRSRTVTPPPNEDERDRRTVFVQQLAARLRTRDLIAFFEKAGPVKEAQIVKDRVSGRSKGVGYVEFKSEESVPLAIQLTGQKLLGIPIIAQNAEAEKNRAARNTEGSSSAAAGVPFHRLYVGNIHFSITESDLQNVFDPFGELEFVQLQKEDAGRSRGYGFVQFRDPDSAKEALEKMNGFELAGRPIRVGLGNDKFTPESTANLLQRFGQGNGPSFQGSAFSGHGGRGSQAGGSGGSFDRIGGRDNDKGAGGASALDDTDVAGVNFNNYSRDALMRKLARTEDPVETNGAPVKQPVAKPRTETKPLPVNVSQASRCVVLKNCFDPAQESGDEWVKELEEEVRVECQKQYGHVVHIAVEPNSAGEIYIKFDSIASGERAILGLNGRYFGGFQITAQPVVDAVYSSLFSRTRAM